MMTFAKSLRGTREAGGLYRAGQDNLVPDFTRGGPRLVQIAEEPSLDGAGRTRMKGVVAELEKGKPMSEQALESGKVPAARVVPAGSGGRWIGNPFAPRATLRADAKGQLTLEFVKVVRNDLSDADLELAPARPKTPAPVPPAPGVPEVVSAPAVPCHHHHCWCRRSGHSYRGWSCRNRRP